MLGGARDAPAAFPERRDGFPPHKDAPFRLVCPAWDLKRKRIEELFIWHKLIDRIRQVKKRRVPRMNVLFLFALLGLS